MPRYDYRCEAGHRYEVMEPFGSPSVHACQRCGKEARRQLVAPTVVFKGPGFYKTSSRANGSNGSASESSTGTVSNRSKTPPKQEKTPAASSSSDD